jgi:hypothetical protein
MAVGAAEWFLHRRTAGCVVGRVAHGRLHRRVGSRPSIASVVAALHRYRCRPPLHYASGPHPSVFDPGLQTRNDLLLLFELLDHLAVLFLGLVELDLRRRLFALERLVVGVDGV